MLDACEAIADAEFYTNQCMVISDEDSDDCIDVNGTR
jgi:hypothetical protein